MKPLIKTLNGLCMAISMTPVPPSESKTMRVPYLTYQGLTEWANLNLYSNVRPVVVSDKAEWGEWVIRWTDVLAALENQKLEALHALMASNPIAVVFDAEHAEIDAGEVWARMYSKLNSHGWRGLAIHLFDEEPLPEEDIDVHRLS
jgi:hypothetical protein